MGAILARFRKEKTTFEKLQCLEQEISDIEAYSISTQEKQKRFVGNFLVISIGLYVIAFLVFYFLFFPPTWQERIIYSTPLLIFPLLIFLIKRLVAWYFERKIGRNSKKLGIMKEEKQKIIEQVKDKETYKVALEILNRFGDKTNGFKAQALLSTPNPTNTPRPQPQLKNSAIAGLMPAPNAARQLMTPVSSKQLIRPLSQADPNSSLAKYSFMRTPSAQQQLQQSPAAAMGQMQPMFGQRTPFPIIDQSKQSLVEKMVDYLIGDGPSNRFAMICKECLRHNGMAQQEDYEYTAFRCAYCNTLNPSRKLRPVAPRLPSAADSPAVKALTSGDDAKQNPVNSSSSSSTSERDSGSDSDEAADQPAAIEEPIIDDEQKELPPPKEEEEKKND